MAGSRTTNHRSGQVLAEQLGMQAQAAATAAVVDMAAPPQRCPCSSCHPPGRATSIRCRLFAIGRAVENCRSSTGCSRGPRTDPLVPQSPGRKRRTAARSPSRSRSREEKRGSRQRRALHWAQPEGEAAEAAPGTGRPRRAAAQCESMQRRAAARCCAHGAAVVALNWLLACVLRAEQSGPAFASAFAFSTVSDRMSQLCALCNDLLLATARRSHQHKQVA